PFCSQARWALISTHACAEAGHGLDAGRACFFGAGFGAGFGARTASRCCSAPGATAVTEVSLPWIPGVRDCGGRFLAWATSASRAFSRAVMPLAWAWRSWASKSACSCVICGGREGAATEGPGCGAALASEAVATDAPTPRVEAPSARAAAPANCFLEVLDTLRCLPM